MDLIAPTVLCVGTHHKTGTIWMRQVFKAIARILEIPFQVVLGNDFAKNIKDGERIFLANWSSKFPKEVTNRADARILHMIRDPRDVLLSGARYHLVGPKEGETFLHTPREDLAGLSYQEHMKSLSSDEQLVFEMDNKHAETLSEMMDWDYDRINSIELRYEEMMLDTDCDAFDQVLRLMGFKGKEVRVGKRVFWNRSLFGGMAKSDNRNDRMNLHVASGKIAQWRTKMPKSIAVLYAEKFGEDLVTLGYEDHPTKWLEELENAA